jgi:hypothetical protein
MTAMALDASQGRRTLGLSRSTPTLTAAYNLRQFSETRHRVSTEHTASSPNFTLDKIDLIGGNGRWRQRLAEVEFARRAVEEEKRQREMQAAAQEKEQRQKQRETRRRQRQEEEERRREAQREWERQEQLERERQIREAEEAERQRREEQEREWLARQPKTCHNCGGSGKCPACNGIGQLFALFLAPSVKGQCTKGGYGRMQQGCETCYGFKQNLMAEVKKGTGRCAVCDGWGKIKPDIPSPQGGRTRKNSGTGREALGFFMGYDPSPKAGGSSPSAARG